MRLLIKERQEGKTTGLIYASEATGYPIATCNEGMVYNIKMMAEKMGCNIPEPITFSQLRQYKSVMNRYENVLVDEVDSIIGAALDSYLGCHVVGATMSDSLKKYTKRTRWFEGEKNE